MNKNQQPKTLTTNKAREEYRAALEKEHLGLQELIDHLATPQSMLDLEKKRIYLARIHNKLARINEALTRINTGGFGVCKVCQKEIVYRRLKSLPYAELCLSCQRQKELRNTKEIRNGQV